MNSTITADRLTSIAADLIPAVRELAHSDMPDGSRSAEDFAVGYVRAMAETCGALAADQCAAGEAWEPEEWLSADTAAVREAAEQMEVTLDAAAWRELTALYRAPSDGAFTVCGLARPAGRFVVVREDGSLSCSLREALCSTEAEAEAALDSLVAVGLDDHEVRPRLVHHL